MKSQLVRFWAYFRRGHSIYLILFISFPLFVVLQYDLLIEQVPFLAVIFSNLQVFVLIFFAVYIPLATVIGWISHSRGSAHAASPGGTLERFLPKKSAFAGRASSPKGNERLKEITEKINAFKSCVQETKDISAELEELTRLFKSGEVSQSGYEAVRGELVPQLSASVSRLFELREGLEAAKAKVKLEWARAKIKLKGVEAEILPGSEASYSPLARALTSWEKLIDDIDRNLSSLSMEEELFITEQYTLLLSERLSQIGSPEQIDRDLTACKQRLESVMKRWTEIRRNKIEHIANLELKASRVRDEMAEVEARFAVGEFGRDTYESKMSTLRGIRRGVEKEISEIRSYIDEIDTRVFRASELLREGS